MNGSHNTADQHNGEHRGTTDSVLPVPRAHSDQPPIPMFPPISTPEVTAPRPSVAPPGRTQSQAPRASVLVGAGLRNSGHDGRARRHDWGGIWTLLRRNIPHVIHTFFTSEGRELRHMAGIIFRLLFGSSQVIVIVVISALAGSKLRSKANPSLSEFSDCSKLGIWNSIWAVRALVGVFMVIWEWNRYVEKRKRARNRRLADLEIASVDVSDPLDQHMQWDDETRGPPPSPVAENGRREIRHFPPPHQRVEPIYEIRGPSQPPADESVAPRPTTSSGLPASPQATEFEPGLPSAQRPPPRQNTAPAAESRAQRSRRETQDPPTAGDALFDRMDTFLTATGLLHFILNHVWLYTTVHTCRINDPHIWYLGLSIAGLGYLIVLELLLIAFIVFVLGPILLLILNLIMLCLGRPFDRHGNVIVRAEIPPIEQSIVDKIPMVVYIPPYEPSPKPTEGPNDPSGPGGSGGKGGNVTDLEANASSVKSGAKPQSTTPARPTRSRFVWWWKRGKKAKAAKPTMWSDAKLVTEGDPRFENSDHPFVILESNRADCPICLAAFVEPKRKEGVPPAPPRPKTPEPVTGQDAKPSSPAGDIESQGLADDEVATSKGKVVAHESTPEDPEADGDAGVPGEALRLLACGHVFHQYCLDPWLLKTSGRCPVCNRKVEIPDNSK